MKQTKNNAAPRKKVAMVGYKKTEKPSASKETKRKANKKTVITALVCSALVVAITVGILISLFSGGGFDYMKSDLGEYILLSEADYKDYTLNINFDTVTDADVERKIMNLLYKNRAKEASNKGAEVTDVPVSVGDTVKIYYRGYTVDENGRENEVAGTSNMTGEYHSLDIGSLSTVIGFEEGLIGAVPAEHLFSPSKNLIREGGVLPGDVIYLSYTVMYPDGRSAKKTGERIDLRDPNLNEYYGEGFREYFDLSNIIIGSEILETKTFSYEDGDAVYFDMTVHSAIRCAAEPLMIEAQFPAHYSEKSLRGKKVYFDVYFKSSVVYETPEYDETFIKETLKVTEEQLEIIEAYLGIL